MFPSGDQIHLQRGDHAVTVVTVGGGLREYTVGGRPVLDGYAPTAIADGARGQLLAPWPNRLRDGTYEWAGRRLQLPLTEPERGNAIHGLVRWVPWQVVDAEPDRARLRLDLPPQPGYPFQLRLGVEHALDENGLRVRQTATNAGRDACPYASGAHPYLAAGAGGVDACRLRVPAARRLLVDERQIPTGSAAVGGTAFDFRAPRLIGGLHLDTAYADLERDAEGRATAELRTPDWTLRVWVDAAHSHLMVFSGDTLAVERRRQGLAVEPMTGAPNALQSGDGLRVLQPGETFAAEWGISVTG